VDASSEKNVLTQNTVEEATNIQTMFVTFEVRVMELHEICDRKYSGLEARLS